MSEYTEQANQFLQRNGIKFRATVSDSKPPPWSDDGKPRHHYRVTLSKSNYEGAYDIRRPKPKRLVFDFWGSIKDREDGRTQITPYDVLACISGDVNTPEAFEDYCAEYGENEDSIQSLQVFRRVSRFAKRLRAFFTEQEITELQEIQ